jgi:protein SCO1/2
VTDTGGGPSDAPSGALPVQAPLSEAERAAALAGHRPPIDRSAALRAGRTPVPRKVIVGMIVAFAVIGLGGVVAEHFLGNVGAVTSIPNTTLPTTGAPPTPTPPATPQLTAPLDAFIGLKSLGTAPAPDLVLQDQTGGQWSLQDQTGKVVVVTFFNTGCNDICPVLGEELRQARILLGPAAADVEFAVVNTDLNDMSVTADPQALTITGLQNDPSVHFLTGTLRQLDAIWAAYGVQVTVGQTSTQLAHNDILYFVDPQGRLRSEAVPFANENQRGGYLLPAADVTRFAQGIARTAASLTPSR